jgi:TonB-linked SusC/RagA family outer membrane protein
MCKTFTQRALHHPGWKRRMCSLLPLLLICAVSYAQNQNVTGRITDAEDNSPLPGASIILKGTSIGTTTDANGAYSISVPDENAILVFSFIGYASQEVQVNGRTQVNIALSADIQALEEIVVVGYGTQRKRDLTGAVSQVDAAKIAHQSPNSVTDILRANIPGLNVGFSNTPKGVSQMEVRGKNTLTAGSSPLIVVDGMIYNGDLSDINPADIDKVDVMKDASSAAVYGARGANGVVLITTKRGASDKPTIALSSSFGLATDAIVEKPYDPDGYARWRTDVFKSINVNHAATPGIYDNPDNLPPGVTLEQWLAYDGASGDPTRAWLNRIGFQDVEIDNYLAGRSVNWYDKIFQTGIRNDITLSLSGAKDELKYYWSVNRTDNEGIIVGDEFETIRSRLNVEGKINKFLTVGINTQFAHRDESSVPANWEMVTRNSPWGSEFDDEGNLRLSPQDDNGAGAIHPLLRRTYTDRRRKFNTLNSRFYTQVALPLGFSYEFAFTNRFEWNSFFNHQSSDSPEWGNAVAFREHTEIQEWQMDNILRWDKTVGDHSFNATFLAYAENYESFFDHAENSLFSPNDDLGYHNLGLGSAPVLSGDPDGRTPFIGDQKSTGDALMGRLNYGYKSKYLLTLSMRRDGYSAFGRDNRRATFPSAAVGWVISEESFFNSDVLDFVKLRLSWGENGNREIGRYSALSQLEAGKNLIVNSSGSVQPVSTLSNTTMANNTLRWERTEAWNIGLDFNILAGRIDGSIDAYKMNTNDLLVSRALPPIMGFGSVLTNLGEIENKGFELSLQTRNLANNLFVWTSNFNFSLNRNKVISLYGDLDADGNELDDVTNRWFIGHALDEIWGQKVLGIWQSDQAEEADLYGVFPGDFRILDKNNDRVFTIEDNEFLGFSKPRFRWTFVNNFQIRKNIDFSFEIYSYWGQSRAFNNAKNRSGFIDRTNSLQTPYWTPENPSTEWARLFSSQGSSSFNVYRKASFIRLQNVTLSYTFPQALTEKIALQNLRIYGNIRNAAVYAPDWEVYDPEAAEVDGVTGQVPTPRYFTIGLNASL